MARKASLLHHPRALAPRPDHWLGAPTSFSEDAFRTSLGAVLDAFRGLGVQSAGLAPPGRDMDRITPERALRVLISVAEQREEQYPGSALSALTIIDVPPAIKAMVETVRAITLARSLNPTEAES